MARDDAPSSKEIDSMLQRLERRLETLKKQYRRYFLGIDLRPPNQLRKQVVREIFELEQTFISNTAQKFKLRSLTQSFNTHKTRWNRVMRQIEEGTYKRDKHKAKRRQRERERQEREQPQQQAFELSDDDFIDDLQEIDLNAIFEQPGGNEPIMPGQANPTRQPQPQRQPSRPQPAQPSRPQPAQPSAADKERLKQQRLAEIQRKLGMGGGGGQQAQPSPAAAAQSTGDSARQQKLAAMRRKLNRNQSGSNTSSGPQRPSTGAHRAVSRNQTGKTGNQPKQGKRNSKLDQIRRKLAQEEKSKNQPSSPTGSHRRVVRRSTKEDK